MEAHAEPAFTSPIPANLAKRSRSKEVVIAIQDRGQLCRLFWLTIEENESTVQLMSRFQEMRSTGKGSILGCICRLKRWLLMQKLAIGQANMITVSS